MIYAVKCINYCDAQNLARKYMNEFKLQISEVKRYNAIPVIILKDRNELHFVPVGKTFDRWCLGMTYKFLGSDQLYHGGYPVKDKIPTKSD